MTTIWGTSGNDVLTGDVGDDDVHGLDGNDTLDGGAGADTLIGGSGDDTYLVDDAGDVVTEQSGEGTDTVLTDLAAYALGSDVENLTYTGSGDFVGTGNELDNVLTGASGNDTLDGGTGADSLIGGAGDDTYVVDDAGDLVVENASEGTDTVLADLGTYTLGSNLENLTYTGSGDFAGTGNGLGNVLNGGSGADTLDGGAGADTLIGGAGNDSYVVDDAGDVVTEQSGEGADTVLTDLATYTLPDNAEKLTYTGSADFAGTGNGSANTLTGGAGSDTLTGLGGNDWLDGGAGADSLIGGTGNDTYVVDDAGDVVIENAGEGTDTVRTSLNTYTAPDNVENVVFTGSGDFAVTGNDQNNSLTGGSGQDTLIGLAGNDTLNGGSGADLMIGGTGNDTYTVDAVGDVVSELPGAGTDTVRTGLGSYTLGDDVENLTHTGSSPFTGTGNELDNSLTGGSGVDTLFGLDGNDTLNGGSGADSLIGGTGDDTYIVDNAGDVVTENAGEGTDTVKSGVSYALPENVENLILTGSNDIDGSGNGLDNTITGNGGGNVLDGGIGADTLIGGAGDDTYIVDDAGDVVTENAGQGVDEVRTGLSSYTLPDNVEKLTYTGTGDFAGTGNGLDNVLNGAGGKDTLSGGDGDDTLAGGAGADVLDGGAGSDTADYSTSGQAVAVDLGASTASGGDAAGDTLTSIENLTGSAYDDSLTGDGGDNVLIGGAGADTLTGGGGTDTASYAPSTSGVVVDLASGAGTAGDAAGDVLSGIENLTGGSGDDVLRGDGGANLLDGGAGNDTLEGRGGGDTLIGGSGTDTAVLSGNVADYLATDDGGTWTFTDLAGGDGTDTLIGVERVQFADRLIFLDGTNNAPIVSENLSEATDEDAAPLAFDLLQGAWDFDGDAVSVTGLTQTAGWSVTATLVDGVLTIDPGQLNALALGESETLVFTYGVTDGTDATTRTLSVTVEGRNDAPTVAAALSASTDEDAAPLVVNLLQGASDADLSDTLSVTGLTQTGGMGVDVTLVGGVLTFDPDQLTGLAVGESEVLAFTYDVTDGIASTAQTMTITVEGRNDAPTAGDDVVDGGTGGTALITLAHLLANDSDPDTSDALSITGVSNATNGTIAFDSNGAVLFTPTTGFIGDAGFDYTISDGNDGTDTAHVTVAVDGAASAFTSLLAEDEVRDAGVSGLAQHLDQGYVATLNDGGYVKVWWTEDGNNSDVYARRYDVDGTAVGAAFRVNTTTALNQSVPSVAALADGGFLISWASMDGSWVNGDLNPGKIYQQRYAADGTTVGGETQVSTNTTSPKNHPSTAALADGGWITTWASFGVDQTGTWGIYRQRYAADGTKVGNESRTNTTAAGSQLNPQAIALESGGFVIAWNSNDGQDGSGSGVYFQQYDADGVGVGTETRANVTTAGNQGVGSIASLSDGGFVVTWSGDGGQDGNGYGVFGKVYNSNGSARTGEFQLNQLSTDGQLHPAVAGLTDGSFVVLWRSFDDVTGEQVIMGRRYEADGDAIGGEFQVSDDSYPVPGITRSHPSVAARADGGFVAYWQDPTTGDTAYVTKVFAASDEAPVILARDVVTIVGGTAAITTLFDPSHLQGDQWVGGALQQISLYEFSDQTAVSASGHLVLDGAAVSAETTITVTADELDRLVWRAGEGVGTDTVMVRGYDGERWSDWVEVSAATVAAASALTAGTEMADAGVNGVAQVLDHGSVTTLADGGYVKVWWTADDNTSDVYARRYDAAGTAMGDAFKVNTASAFNQDAPTVAALADGGFVISWGSMDGSWTYNNNTGHIFQQRYDGAGVAIGGETRVSSNATSPKNHPSTVGLADGGWITVWQSFGVDQASTWGVYRQRYDADGIKVGGEARVNTTSAGSQGDVKVISLTDGGFVVQWDSVNGQDGSGSGIYVQRYDADGGAVGGETRINVTTAGDQSVGSLAALSDGGYIVTWSDGSGHDGDGTGVYGRVIGADGLARTGEIQINQTTTGDQKHPAVTQLADGSIMVLWSSIDPSTDVEVIKGRRFDGDGAALADEFQVSDGSHTTPGITRSHPSISARADGGFVAYWQEPTATDTVFITKVFSPDGTMEGTYLGTDGSDVLFGSSGTDTLTGGLGADVFHFETPDVGLDTITDFQSGMDVIEVVSANFGGLAAGPLDASRFALNAAADADTRFIFDTTTKVLSYDADGTGAGAAVGLASLNVSTLSNTNIFVVS